MNSTLEARSEVQAVPHTTRRGCLIVNADDWGLNVATTDRIRECFDAGALSSTSAMVFMEDSERAAAIAADRGLDCGLHLNLTQPLTGNCSATLAAQQKRIAVFLRGNRFAQILFHPGLMDDFRHAVTAQIEDFARLYRATPARIDGHHHMHLATNVLAQKLLPAGTILRRNFSFTAGEKSLFNRAYRRMQDGHVTKKFRTTDYFFALPPIERVRLQRIISLAEEAMVEVETHPVNSDEHKFLTSGEIFRWLGNQPLAPSYVSAFSAECV